MEIRKSSRADLEHRRSEWFLMGLAAAAALLYVVLEYDYRSDGSDFDFDLQDEATFDLELAPLADQQDMVPLPFHEQEPPRVADKLNVVDEEHAEEQQPDDVPDIMPIEGVDEASVEQAEVEQTLPMETDDDPTRTFRVVEELPEFPGGPVAMMKWLTRNLRYPSSAQQRKVQGRVVAQFIVNTDGSLSDISIVQPVEPSLDREAMRVLRMMPKWKAGQQDNKPCRTMVCIPIVFKL